MMRKFAFASVFAAGSASGQRSAADVQQADSPPLALPPLELNETFLDDKKTEEKENEGLGSNLIVAERHTVNSLLTTCYERYFSSSSISPPHNDGDGSDRRDSATLESIGRSVAASEQQRQSSSSNRANDRIAHCAHALFNTSGTSSSISRVEFDSIVADVQERVEDRDLVEEVLDNLRPSHKKKKEEAKKKKNSLPSIPLSKNIAANLPPNDPKWDSLRAKFCCVICQDVMVFPMVVTCGHSFCGECLDDYMDSPHVEATCCPECRCSISYGAGTYERKLDQVILDMVHEIDDKSSVQKAEWLARHKKYRARLNGDKMSRLVFEKGVNFAVAVLSVLSLVLITALITTRASMSK